MSRPPSGPRDDESDVVTLTRFWPSRRVNHYDEIRRGGRTPVIP
jgi:hypothetical protein